MAKLCLVIPMWRRYSLTNHLLTYYHGMKVDGVDITIVAVGSEGSVSRQIARGLEYVEADNHPLDAKYDAGIAYCKKFDPDAVCLIGSDDFITAAYWSWAMYQVASGCDLAGLLDFYVADMQRGRVLYWGGYNSSERQGESIAAGRVYSRRILNKVAWRPYWTERGYLSICRDDERALANVRNRGGNVKSVNMAAIGCQYWAVKTGDEFNTVDAFESQYPTVTITDHSWLLFRTETGL